MKKSLNSLFSNVHRLIYGWPEGHTFKHLKCLVLLMLVDERHDVVGKLQTHLDKSKLSYQEAVCAIRDLDTDEPIPEHLGDFILAAISIAINIPIIVVKPIIERTQDANLRPIMQKKDHFRLLLNYCHFPCGVCSLVTTAQIQGWHHCQSWRASWIAPSL